MQRGASLALFLVIVGCDANAPLLVDVRTDYAPGQEVDAIRVEVLDASATLAQNERALSGEDDVVVGLRGLEVTVPTGSYRVRVTLLREDAPVAQREILVELAGPLAVTVLLTRSCAEVSCEAGTSCVGGICVDERCTPETPDACPAAPQCTGDVDCVASVACLTPTCVEGSCFAPADDAMCAPTDRCDVAVGCVPPDILSWADGGPTFGTAEPLGAVNVPGDADFDPFLSADGLTLYFASRRADASDVFVATRPSLEEPFGAALRFDDASSAGDSDSGFRQSADGLYGFLTSDRDTGDFDVYLSIRASPSEPFASWRVVPELSSAEQDSDPALAPGLLYLASRRPGGPGGFDIWVADVTLPTTFGAPRLVEELNTTDADTNPTLSGDGLVIVFASNRPGGMGQALWYATRGSIGEAFGAPVRIDVLDTPDPETEPFLRRDGRELLFVRGSLGGSADLYRVDID